MSWRSTRASGALLEPKLCVTAEKTSTGEERHRWGLRSRNKAGTIRILSSLNSTQTCIDPLKSSNPHAGRETARRWNIGVVYCFKSNERFAFATWFCTHSLYSHVCVNRNTAWQSLRCDMLNHCVSRLCSQVVATRCSLTGISERKVPVRILSYETSNQHSTRTSWRATESAGVSTIRRESTGEERDEIFSRQKCKARTVLGRGVEDPPMWPRIWVTTTREREKEGRR